MDTKDTKDAGATRSGVSLKQRRGNYSMIREGLHQHKVASERSK